MLIILFLVLHFNFLFIPRDRLPVSFLLHVKYTLSYRIVSYGASGAAPGTAYCKFGLLQDNRLYRNEVQGCYFEIELGTHFQENCPTLVVRQTVVGLDTSSNSDDAMRVQRNATDSKKLRTDKLCYQHEPVKTQPVVWTISSRVSSLPYALRQSVSQSERSRKMASVDKQYLWDNCRYSIANFNFNLTLIRCSN